jgi:hypothetical protein
MEISDESKSVERVDLGRSAAIRISAGPANAEARQQ